MAFTAKTQTSDSLGWQASADNVEDLEMFESAVRGGAICVDKSSAYRLEPWPV